MAEAAPRERSAPLVGVVAPAGPSDTEPFGSYAAVVGTGRSLLASELSRRLGALGAAVTPLRPDGGAHWGRWYADAMRPAVHAAHQAAAPPADAIGYAGAGSLALFDDDGLEQLLSPIPGEAVANNRFSADAFVVAGDLEVALDALEACPTDNAAVRALESAGFRSRDLATSPWSRFDVDTPLDLALLRLAGRLPASRQLDGAVRGFLEMAVLPGGGRLEIPRLAEVGAVLRDRSAELVVAGRVPSATLAYLETEAACRVRAFVEERGMRAAREGRPRSLLAGRLAADGARRLIAELGGLGDAVVLDTRVLMATHAGSSDAATWPPEEERFASDFLDARHVSSPWLAELTDAAAQSTVPVLLGGHALVSDGLRLIVEASWLGH